MIGGGTEVRYGGARHPQERNDGEAADAVTLAGMRITTARLELREYTAEDLPALIEYQSDPRAREFYGPDEGAPGQLAELLGTFLSWAAEEPRRNWQLAIALRSEPARVVGSCGLRTAGLEPRCAELGLDLSAELWGRGYGPEATGAILDFGFDVLGLDRVRGETISANGRVAHMLERLGFRPGGTRSGGAWMAARGWAYADWEISVVEWRKARPGRPLPRPEP